MWVAYCRSGNGYTPESISQQNRRFQGFHSRKKGWLKGTPERLKDMARSHEPMHYVRKISFLWRSIMTKKLSLDQVKVSSFVTGIQARRIVAGVEGETTDKTDWVNTGLMNCHTLEAECDPEVPLVG